LKIADYSYVLENGRIVHEGTGQALEQDPKVREAYLGI
jgi:branched-chain amino acid transport system ATP-binding protein